MKIFTKITSMIMLTLMIFSTVPAMASEIDNVEQSPQPFYFSFTGTVKELEDKNDGLIRVYLEKEDGTPAYFILSDDTYYVNNVEIVPGKEITGYYESGKPMILIYPPQYSIDIVAPVIENGFIKADKFDSSLLSRDKTLKLNISEDSEIFWENGVVMNWFKAPTISELELALSNRQLIVFYNFTTKSIPAQTTPSKVIVLSEQIDDSMINIYVNDILLENKTSYIDENGITMLPVRAISEALGYDVSWNNQERSVNIGNNTVFKIGINSYTNSQSQSKTLETAPIIKNDRSFVPLSFFKEILNVKVTDFFENTVVINDGSNMNEEIK